MLDIISESNLRQEPPRSENSNVKSLSALTIIPKNQELIPDPIAPSKTSEAMRSINFTASM
jgi:hypothetical protein